MAIMTDSDLQKALDGLTEAYNRVHQCSAKISDHCAYLYGVSPADVDNDAFIDSVAGGCGMSTGMSVDEFKKSMLDAMEAAGMDLEELGLKPGNS
jgi:hypothetical protein